MNQNHDVELIESDPYPVAVGDQHPRSEAGFDHQRFAIYVWRSVRAHGDTKTGEVTPDTGTAHAGR